MPYVFLRRYITDSLALIDQYCPGVPFFEDACRRSHRLITGPLRICEHEIHHRRWVHRPDWKMSLAGLFDDRHLAAELLVAFFRDSRLAVKPGVELAAHMEDRHARFGQR